MAIARIFRNGATRRLKPETILKESPLLSKIVRMLTYREALPCMAVEVDRARRYRRPLSVLVVQFDESETWAQEVMYPIGGDGGNGDGVADQRPACYPELLLALLLGGVLRDELRETDLISYDPDSGRYIIMMPELTESQAHSAAQRLSDLVFTRTFTPIRAGIAQFPDDGMTLEEMISSAVKNCDHISNMNLISEQRA